ncbi:MAG: FkbM family methyltransferase, partial [Rhodospirillales bacterium]|nr:FkbM family methyltransferase [Rhodospirillales bacterium]
MFHSVRPRMTFVSYAQNYEDVMLRRALRGVDQGFYIDVGANDPNLHSVTKAFYLEGWRGINIDPVPACVRRLQAERSRDITLPLAAGAASGSVTLYEIPDTGLSTIDPSVAEQHRAAGYPVRTMDIGVRTLSSICAEYVTGEIHFLKIDVEGAEKDVLLGLDLMRWRPWIIVVEAMAPMAQHPTHQEWEALILSGRYRFAYADGLNRYYIAEEHAELSGAFDYPPNVFDDFTVVACRESQQRAEAAERRAESAERSLRRAEQDVAKTEAVAADLAGQVRDLRQRLASEAVASQSVAEHLRERETQLDLVYRSRSWRITAPLRKLSIRVRRVVRHDARPNTDDTAAQDRAAGVPTIFIECTHTYHSDVNTGIQRVVRNVVRHARDAGAALGYKVVPVILSDDRLVEADIANVLRDKVAEAESAPDAPIAAVNEVPHNGFRGFVVRASRPVWRFALRSITKILPSPRVHRFVYAPPCQPGLSRLLLQLLRYVGWRSTRLRALSSPPARHVGLDERSVRAGDILLLLDSSWSTPPWPAVRRFKERGGRIAGVIYDLIPVTHPHTCVPELVRVFGAWLANYMALADASFGISRTTSQQLAAHFAEMAPGRVAAP